MRVIATYLPQFHKIKENDEWWGEGFTDWTAVCQAEKFFPDHYEPRVPLDGYYDLLDKNVMKRQAELMHKYDVDGLCFYHYYFEKGKKILEKPAENLLEWKDIDMPFCFCWANESWIRSWSNIPNANSWADKYDKKNDNNEDQYLMKQDYGDIGEWKLHFDYLLPFFKDERYIRVEDKPLFWIYRCSLFPRIQEMVDYWKSLAMENDLPGLYIVGTDCIVNRPNNLDAYMMHEPVRSLMTIESTMKRSNTTPFMIDYDELWQTLLKNRGLGRKVLFEGFVDYDDTPRRGVKGRSVVGVTPLKFRRYLSELMAKSSVYGNDIVFVNAWNEWGEGMALEPNDRDGYLFLEAIAFAKKNYGEYIDKYRMIYELLEDNGKLNEYLDIYEKWIELIRSGYSIGNYLKKKGIYNVAIYGYSRFGKSLIYELKGTEVRVNYFIDKKLYILDALYPIYSPDDELPNCDAVIVAAPYYFDSIAEKLIKKGIGSVLSVARIIDECMAE